jgi:hypothetical protein
MGFPATFLRKRVIDNKVFFKPVVDIPGNISLAALLSSRQVNTCDTVSMLKKQDQNILHREVLRHFCRIVKYGMH